jgi:lysophospholipase L1-like esterase
VNRFSAVGAIAAIAAIYVVVAGCGGTHAVQAADRAPVPAVAVDRHLDEPAQWGSPKAARDKDGAFVAQLSPGGSSANRGPVEVSLGGVGWPLSGEGLGDPYVAPAILSKWTEQGGTYTVSLTTSAQRVSAAVWNLGGSFQIRVGSTAVGSPRAIGTTYHHHDLEIEFATSARRTITFELSGAVYFSGLRVGGGSTQVSFPTVAHPPPSVYWVGDSYVAGGGSTYPGFDDLAHLASAQAGLTDVTTDALGGTGYVRANASAHFPPYLARARFNLGPQRARPQLIVVGGSINDAVYSEARVKRAAAALYAFLRRAVPKARVVVIPFASAYPVPAAEAAANEGVLQAAQAAPNVVGVLDLPARVASLAGTAGVKRRSGALDSRTVKYHPSEAGHQLYGRIIGSFLADCVTKLKRGADSRGVCDQAN